ncbi:hypothetical protein GGTG_08503 [Gaeumannomyces tritici R3-111a-1]|uniref:Uncharacterized protein n=1 Tax=Gaeumannomyces tritici (strain R3-111a-1) TaxID=644352 RepID=J3P4R6_GAET3|nr:hypothetical protein GGTG_08503 [Gaeumannomyces tritici R3-111a-1]EJT74663.1 hypothetical protein GGTG_08503 [Gaeumannomyces tritici R3-111a-1]
MKGYVYATSSGRGGLRVMSGGGQPGSLLLACIAGLRDSHAPGGLGVGVEVCWYLASSPSIRPCSVKHSKVAGGQRSHKGSLG